MNNNGQIHYPDGTKRSRPSDGTIYWGANGDQWMWDDFGGYWAKYSPNASQIYTHSTPQPIEIIELDAPPASLFDTIKCECGKDKHGFASHSDWCKKYEKN